MGENNVNIEELIAENERLKAELRARMEELREAEEQQTTKTQDVEEVEVAEENAEIEENAVAEESAEAEETEEIEGLTEIEIESSENKKARNRKIINIIYDLFIVVGIALLLYGGFSLYESYRDDKEAEQDYDDLENNFVKDPANLDNSSQSSEGVGEENTETEKQKEWYEMIWVDLEGMQTQINPDIVGWIFFENEDISYPILYSEDNAEYDRVMYNYEYSKGGSITLEAENRWDFSDIRNVIYGHNMKNGTMFGKLRQYNEIDGYYNEHQYFQLIYDGMVYRYQIFSYFKIHETEVSYINVGFEAGSESYEEFLKLLIDQSMIDTDITVTNTDKTVTLLTCAPNNKYRFLVNAVLVDQHVLADVEGNYPNTEDTETGTDTEMESESGTDTETGEDTEPESSEIPPETEGEEVRPGSDTYTYTAIGKNMWATTAVKIRNQPSMDGVRIGYLAKDTKVYVEAVCNETGWYRVKYNRITGYVNGAYLTDVEPVIESTESESTETGTETPTPEPTESETPTPEPTESETPTPEPTESETPTPEPTESETPEPEPTESETTEQEPTESETPEPEPTESEPTEPETTESETTESEAIVPES